MSITPKILYSGGQINDSATQLVLGFSNVTATIITTGTFTNTDTISHLLSVYIVRNGGSAIPANALIYNLQLYPGQSYISPEIQGQILGVGDTLQAIADVSAKITCSGIPGYIVTQ